MFTTLRCGNDTLVAARADSSHTSLACNTCRVKKLKCTREKAGCHRCISRNIECEYPDPAQKKSKKRKLLASRTRMKENTITPPGSSSTDRDESTNQSRMFARSPRTPSWELNTFGGRLDFTDRSFDINITDDIGQSEEMDMLRDSQYSLDHTFEESFDTLNQDTVSSLSLFSMDIRLLEESDFFFPPWGEKSPPSADHSPLPPSVLHKTQYSTPESNPCESPCHCTTQALSLLEAVVHHDTLATLSSVPRGLSLNKRTIARCKKLLECPRCSGASSFVNLLILLCQQIVASYEHIISMLCEQLNNIHPDNQFTARGESVELLRASVRQRVQERMGNEGVMLNDLAMEKRLLFKDYEVDAEEEPCVFGGLTSMQLKTLALFLGRLRGVARGWEWGTHVLMVDAVEKRVLALLRVTNSCGGSAEAG